MRYGGIMVSTWMLTPVQQEAIWWPTRCAPGEDRGCGHSASACFRVYGPVICSPFIPAGPTGSSLEKSRSGCATDDFLFIGLSARALKATKQCCLPGEIAWRRMILRFVLQNCWERLLKSSVPAQFSRPRGASHFFRGRRRTCFATLASSDGSDCDCGTCAGQ